MLLHHDQRDQAVAEAKAAKWAHAKLETMIEKGRASTKATLERIDRTLIEDIVTPARRVRFFDRDGAVLVELPRLRPHGRSGAELVERGIHRNALGQIMGRTEGTKKVADWAYTPDTAPEFASILNKKFTALGDKRYLARSVDGELRGLMSDRYRRLDVRPLVEALVQTAVEDHGAVPLDAKVLDTSFQMKLVLPTIYEPLPNELGVFGLTFRNSDFGAGRLYVKGFFDRLWCTNLAMCEDAISQVHLGRSLSDNVAFSQRTYELDTMTMASAIKDVVKHIFSLENIAMRMLAIKEASETDEKTDIGAVLKRMHKGGKLLKGESEEVATAFNSADVELLPPGQTKWRLSNAISLIAQKAEPDRQLELETLAGEVAGLVRQAA